MLKIFLFLIRNSQSNISYKPDKQILIFRVLFLDFHLWKIKLNLLSICSNSSIIMVVQKFRVIIILTVNSVLNWWRVRAHYQHVVHLHDSSRCLSLCVHRIPLYCQLKQTAGITDWADVVIQVAHSFAFLCINRQPSEVWFLALNPHKCCSWVHNLDCMRLAWHSDQVQRFWL